MEDRDGFRMVEQGSWDAPDCIADEGYLKSLVSPPRGLCDFTDDGASRPRGGRVWRRVWGIGVANGDASPPTIGIPCLVSVVRDPNKNIHLSLMSEDPVADSS